MKQVARTFPAKLNMLDEVLGFAEEQLETSGCPMKAQMAFTVCLEEAFVNVASYAYPDSEGEAELVILVVDDKITATLSDEGIPFNPMEKEDPDITLSAEERGIGGLGIFMVKRMLDDVGYERIGDRNILTMVKSFT